MSLLLRKGICLLLLIVTFFACKREYSCEDCNNVPPFADAGVDTTITLPLDSIQLEGSGSTDSDGTIVSYKWAKIKGLASSTIVNPSGVQTLVKKLTAGDYLFELTVTDNSGSSAKDTVQVSVKDGTQPNRAPIARAGPDQVILLPTNSVILDATASSDPDNNILGYTWSKISGPAEGTLASTTNIKTGATNLVEGSYQFEVKVIDVGGLFSKDTVLIKVERSVVNTACSNDNRPIVDAKLIPVGTLSQTRNGIAVAAAGNKILFAGGFNPPDQKISRVDIYDLSTKTWSTTELSVARHGITTVVAGNKIFFAGGEVGDGTSPVTKVDIYDAATGTWSTSALSIAGHNVAAAAVGNKVFFAGGDGGSTGISRGSRVDIYDLTTGSWSITSFSEFNQWPSAVALNNKIYFAGGEIWEPNSIQLFASKRIDIYDNITGTWSTSSLNEPRFGIAAIAVGNKIYWAGGYQSAHSNEKTCSVEILDVNLGITTTQYLSSPAAWDNTGQQAVVKESKIVFYSNDRGDSKRFDIYDVVSQTWSIGLLPMELNSASIISVNNTIYLAGGETNGSLSDKVWMLEF